MVVGSGLGPSAMMRVPFTLLGFALFPRDQIGINAAPPAAGVPNSGAAPGGPNAQLEQLLQVLGAELAKEDKKPGVPQLKFQEFQEVEELSCHNRLLYIAQYAMDAVERLRSNQGDTANIAGLYWPILKDFPHENTWIWQLLGAQERLTNEVIAYFSRLAVLSLDGHHCIPLDLRRVFLAAVIRWKELQSDLSRLTWSGYAFGRFGDEQSMAELAADEAAAVAGDSASGWPENLMLGNKWISKSREWFELHVQELLRLVQIALPGLAPNAEDGSVQATRMHHQDGQGMFSSFEYLRRKHFGQWALDKGLLRGLLRHVWKPSYDETSPRLSLADFGAGGGQYCNWLNDTGLVDAFAFDGTPGAAEISQGSVQEINLVSKVELHRTFDWVLCLEVGEHVPKEFEADLLQNLRRHATKGLIISWSDDWEGIGHVNCLTREEFLKSVQKHTGFLYDEAATQVVKESCEIDYIARTLAVFRAPASRPV